MRVKNKRADLVPFIKLADNGFVPENEFADASGAKWVSPPRMAGVD